MTRARVVLPVPGGPQRITEREPVGLDQHPQRLARAEQVVLADDVVEGPGPQPGRERRLARPSRVLGRRGEQVVRHRPHRSGRPVAK